MKTNKDEDMNDDLLDEYDFASMTQGVRGKYAEQYNKEVKLIMLEPDVAQIFPDSVSVNNALRVLANIARRQEASK